MRQMFSGHNIAQISEELETSVSTVNLRIRAICSKAALENRYQLAVYIFQYPRCLLKGSRCPCGMHKVTVPPLRSRCVVEAVSAVAPVCLLVILHPSSLPLSRKSTKVQTNK
jgi:hypothetical protein